MKFLPLHKVNGEILFESFGNLFIYRSRTMSRMNNLEVNHRAEKALKHLSLEAGVVDNLKSIFQEYLPAFAKDLTELTLHFNDQEHTTYLKDFLFKENRALYKAKQLDYMTYGQTLISIPEGFKGQLLTYGKTLDQQLVIAFNRIENLLGYINTYLSVFLSDKDRQLSMNDVTKYFESVRKERESVIEEVQKFFDKTRSTISKERLNKVIHRFEDIKDFKPVMSSLDKQISRMDLNTIQSKINETIDLTKLIQEQLNKGEIVAITPTVSNSISNGLYESARYVEMISLLYYDTVVYMRSVNSIIDTLIEA